MRKLLILLLIATSCTSPDLQKELETNYETTISLLIENNKQAENKLQSFVLQNPNRYQPYDSVGQELTAVQEEITKLYKSDKNDLEEILSTYKELSPRLEPLIQTFSEPSGYTDEVNNRLGKIAAVEEVSSSFSPKHFACSTLLDINLKLFRELISMVNSPYCGSISWYGQIEKTSSCKNISLYSKHLPDEAYFILNSIVDSRGNTIEAFKAVPNHNVWDISLPKNSRDTAYFLWGSIFAKHPHTAEIFEVDTFLNRKVTSKLPFPEHMIKPLSK